VDVLGASLLGAVGMSLAYIPGTMAAMSGAKPEETGLASGLVNTTYQVGSAIGLAIVVAVAITITNGLAPDGEVTTESLTAGFQGAFRTAAVIGVLGTLVALVGIKSAKK